MIKMFVRMLAISLITAIPAHAVLDYSDMDNWTYHPDKPLSGMGTFNPNIHVINKDGGTDSIISVPNNALVNTGVDIFYVHPTQILDDTVSTPYNLDLNEQPLVNIMGTTKAQAGPLVKYGRLFAPRYREANRITYFSLGDSTTAAVQTVTHDDVAAAFDHYMTNHNGGNKIILAGHSQGSYNLAMLLRSRFDDNPELKEKLVAAVLGGVAATYAQPGKKTGGFWETIAPCTTRTQCGCVMTWRSYLEDHPPVGWAFGRPCDNQLMVDAGLVYRKFAAFTDVHYQDSLYYGTDPAPLRYYMEMQTFNGTFHVFDSMYTARYSRININKVALMVGYTPQPGDTRPDNLAADTTGMGAHNHDYAIYLWALMEQLDEKLDAMAGIGDYVNGSRAKAAYKADDTMFDVNGRIWPYHYPVPPGVYLVPGTDGLHKELR